MATHWQTCKQLIEPNTWGRQQNTLHRNTMWASALHTGTRVRQSLPTKQRAGRLAPNALLRPRTARLGQGQPWFTGQHLATGILHTSPRAGRLHPRPSNGGTVEVHGVDTSQHQHPIADESKAGSTTQPETIPLGWPEKLA